MLDSQGGKVGRWQDLYEVESSRRSLGLAEGAVLRGYTPSQCIYNSLELALARRLCLHPPTDLWKAEFTVTNWSAWQKKYSNNKKSSCSQVTF